MKRERKSPPRPGHNAMSGDGKGLMAYFGHVRAKVVNRTDPNDTSRYLGPKMKPEMRKAQPRFVVTRAA